MTGTWRRGLWKVIMGRWGHKGGVFMMGLVPLQEETAESLLDLSVCMSTHKKAYGCSEKILSTGQECSHEEWNQISQHLILGLFSLQNRGNINFCCLSHSVYVWYFALAPGADLHQCASANTQKPFWNWSLMLSTATADGDLESYIHIAFKTLQPMGLPLQKFPGSEVSRA